MNHFEVLYGQLTKTLPHLELRRDELMSHHTTFKVGGPARLMALPKTEDEVVSAVRLARESGIEPLFIGNGSNLLVDDRGLDAFVVKTVPGLSGWKAEGTQITAGCGLLLSALAVEAARHSLTGLEFAHGIPGSLGGAVTMNAGAYGGELCQVVRAVRVLEPNGRVEEVPAEDLSLIHI